MTRSVKEIVIPHNFILRDYQEPAWKALKDGKKRVVCCWHRGAGKDLFALNWLIYKAIQEKAVYLHLFPQYAQGKRAIWNSIHNTDEGESTSYLDHFPPEIVKYKNSTEMRIELVNGSIYMVMGIDGKNAQLARGMNPTHVIVSEYAYMDPQSWYTIEPRVIQNNGTVLFLSTPNGKNHFYDLYNHAANNGDDRYFASLITNEDTKIVTEEDLQDMRTQGRPEDFIQQEYYCSFTRGAEGSYYGKLIQKAREEERICKLAIKPDLPCHTAWDIGRGDSTAIWIFQSLANGSTNFIHYYENTNEALDHYFRYLDKWKDANKALFGTHFAPHDMANREMTGERLEMARNMGYTMLVLKRDSIEDGIQAVRSLLPSCSFDSINCKRGIQCLDFYRKKWNETLKVYYDEALHDQYSHGADAFRYAAMGLKKYGSTQNKLTADSILDMRRRNLGY